MEYTKEDGERLIELARESIRSKFTGEKVELPEEKQFRQARGVFVTLYSKGELRGCIGIPYPTLALNRAVFDAARSAAFSDPRFSQLSENELKDVKIEISILTIPQICEPKDVVIGRDGLIGEYVGYSGLLLPQVAKENNFSRIDFFEALCRKAGLPKDKWQDKNFKLWKFQAQIFKE